jgi:hypothetical protein
MRFTVSLLAALMAALNFHGAALACGYHPGLAGATFDVVHPKSLGVVVAINGAKQQGLLDDPTATTKAGDLFGSGYRQAVQDLTALETKLRNAAEFFDSDRTGTFALVLVSSRLWSHYRVGGGNAMAEIHASPAGENDTIILSDEAVLDALVNGRMSFDLAVANGLIQIVNDPEGRTAALLEAAFAHQL